MTRPTADGVVIRLMSADDLPAADRIFRLAFGTEFGIADPMTFRGDAGVVAGRFAMFPDGAFVVDVEGETVGFSMANRWGSVGFLGPVCIHPDYWSRGFARRLIRCCVAQIDAWGCTASGLFTNPGSPRHLRLYQDFGFWPRQLTAVMSRPCQPGTGYTEDYGSLLRGGDDRNAAMTAIDAAAGQIYPGLSLGAEMRGLLTLGHGDVLYIDRDGGLDFALCHFGAGSEGGSTALYIKYAQIARGKDGGRHLAQLLAACTARAGELGLGKIIAGVNTRQHAAYRILLESGFRTDMHGVRMNRPYGDLLDEEALYSLGDWR